MYPPPTQFETRELRLAPERLRVVVGEDAGTVRLLEESGFDVVGQAGDRDDLLRKVRAHRPDVAVIDIRGLQAARIIRTELPRVGLLVLPAHLEERYARELLEGGAAGAGYLLKHRVAEVERFIAAVRRVARGGTVLDPEVVAAMVRGRHGAFEALTRRERDVLAELAAGRSNRDIADALFLSERAVERHVTAIIGKLDLPGGDRTHRRLAVAAERARVPETVVVRLLEPALRVLAPALDQRAGELRREEQVAHQLAVQRVGAGVDEPAEKGELR
jgi:DNA-binding NarL/FixJ family response regulator